VTGTVQSRLLVYTKRVLLGVPAIGYIPANGGGETVVVVAVHEPIAVVVLSVITGTRLEVFACTAVGMCGALGVVTVYEPIAVVVLSICTAVSCRSAVRIAFAVGQSVAIVVQSVCATRRRPLPHVTAVGGSGAIGILTIHEPIVVVVFFIATQTGL